MDQTNVDPVFRFLIQFLFVTQQHVIKPSPHRQNCCQKMVHLLLLHFWIPRSMSCNAPSHSLGKKTKESAWISMTLVYRVRLLEYRQIWNTLGGTASICFKFHFQTDYQQTLRTHTQGCQGCQKIRNFVRNSKILIARSTIHPSLSKIKNHYWKTSKIEKKNH